MSAVSATETLRAIGAEAISMQTHISQGNIRRLLAGDFDAFSAIQFNGFVTIIEREYDVDLTEWRVRFAQNVPEPAMAPFTAENDPFTNAVLAKKRQRQTVAILAGLLLLVIVVTYLVLGGGDKEEKIELNNTAIEQAKANMAALSPRTTGGSEAEVEAIQAAHQSEANETGAPATDTAAVQTPAPETAAYEAPAPVLPAVKTTPAEAAAHSDLVIRPKTAVWLGVIDAQTSKRQAMITDEPLDLNGSKTWLIVTGHGFLTMECGETNTTYKEARQMLFLYEDGQCRELDEEEFKARNRGRVW